LRQRRPSAIDALTEPPLEIQHDCRAAELPAPCEFIEIRWTIRSHDTDRADPALAIRLAWEPAELHRQFARCEGDVGTRRTA
jgi:hypothetical protein